MTEGIDGIGKRIGDADGAELPDNVQHLAVLTGAVTGGDPALFADYGRWLHSMMSARGVPADDVRASLSDLRPVLFRHLPRPVATDALPHLDAALADINAQPVLPPSFVDPAAAHGDLARRYLNRLLDGDRIGAADLAENSIEAGLPLQNLYLDVFQPAMREIGRLWQLNRITVAQEHFCTAATQAIMNGFLRRILQTPRNGRTVTAACLGGELHEVGLRMVADMLELDGWNCTYVGGRVPVDDMVRSLTANPPDLVAVSVTMTENVVAVADFVNRLRRAPGLQRVPVLVGGRPFAISDRLWRSVGADGCALDAATALSEARRLAALPAPDLAAPALPNR